METAWNISNIESRTYVNTQLFQQGPVRSQQFPGHPDGVIALIPIIDNVVITGCEDRNIRAVHLYPHRLVYILLHLSYNVKLIP